MSDDESSQQHSDRESEAKSEPSDCLPNLIDPSVDEPKSPKKKEIASPPSPSEKIVEDKQTSPNAEAVVENEEGTNHQNKSENQDASDSNKPEDLSVPSTKDDGASGSKVQVVASHYNAIEEVGIRERTKSRIFYMRNFNNWIKSTLIGEYLTPLKDKLGRGVPLRVMDLGCGKGGDLLKWMRGGVTHVVCADVAEVSMQHCEKRYQEMASKKGGHQPFSAQFITADCTKERLRNLYKKPNHDCIDPTIKFHLVSCQFAFHYCFESIAQANCMLQNAAECLESGGYFIGTVPNAYEIVRRHKEADKDNFGNEVYSITMNESSKGYPLFGATYDFHLHEVVDCPEFLVHFPTLIKLAEKHGLKLVEKLTFDEFYAKNKESGRHLLQKINGLEVYPPHRGSTLLGKQEDYKHAEAFISSNSRCQNVGTLSQPEWDAASLYMVFAFQKVKRQTNLDDFPEVPEAKRRRKLSDESDKKKDR